ncbi:MAG TPA: APC family permease [Chitinophagaceae bacterium]|nr:APC family permease [Chitinophagaceae bacterium]
MLHRGIRKWDLVLMIINSIIGAGIFGLPSDIFKATNVYSIAAFVACAAIVLVFILCFAEVSSRFDKTGGPYVYILSAFGKFPAFLMGWLLLLSRIFNYATLINMLVTYLSLFYAPLQDPVPRIVVIVVVSIFLTYINHIGIRNMARLSNITTIAKLAPLAVFIIAGLFFLNTGSFNASQTPGFPAFSKAVLLLVFAFGGFESVLVGSGEINNPSRTLPFALFTATAVVAIFYILIQVVCIGTLPGLAESKRPIAEAASNFMGKTGGKMIALGAFISIVGTLNVLLFSGSRLPYAFSEEGQFPKWFSFVNNRYKTPTVSLLVVSVLVIITSIAFSFLAALTVATIIRVTVYLLVCASLIRLRKKFPGQRDYYKLKYGNLLAVAGIGLSVWLLSAAKLTELRNVAILLGIGLLVYLMQINSRKNHKKNK